MEKIIKLNYGATKVPILLCFWVQAKTHDAQVAMKNYEFGFTFVNFKKLLPTHEQSFVLPLQIQQMFFLWFYTQS